MWPGISPQIHGTVGSLGFIVSLQSGFSSLYSSQQGLRISPHSPQYLALSEFIILANLRVEMASHFDFHTIFLIPSDNSGFSTSSFQFPFSDWVFLFSYCFLVVYVFWILKLCLANIFSQYLTYLFAKYIWAGQI